MSLRFGDLLSIGRVGIFLAIICSGWHSPAGTDPITYEFVITGSSSCFIAEADTVCFTRTGEETSSPVFSIDVDHRTLYIDTRIGGAYSIDDSPGRYSGTLYLDMPYGKFEIREGIYVNRDMACQVVINNRRNKPEGKLTARDFARADRRRKKGIRTLKIEDRARPLMYASAVRVSDRKSPARYEVQISAACPDKSRILFKSALFMILWIYHQDRL